MTDEKPMALQAEIDRLYGLPLDEFVAQRGALAKRLRGEGDREAAERVKGLRKPTAGAWALNQAVRRRSSETAALLEAGERLRAAHEALISGGGGGRAELREAMEEERSVAGALADCAEAIASETGKSGPALRERVRATLHAAALDPAVREELAAGRLLHEHEAAGLAAFGSEPAAPGKRATKAGDGRSAGSGRSPAPGRERASGRERAAAERERAAAVRQQKARLAEAERDLDEARSLHGDAEAAHARAAEALEAAQAALEDARAAERAARKKLRERKRELETRERDIERLRR